MRDTWAQGTPLYLPISLCGRMKSELWKLLETWEEVLGFLKVSTSQVVLSATLSTAPVRFCSTKLRPVWRAAWEGLQQVSWSDFYIACSPTGRGEVLRKWASETTVSGDHFLSPQYSWWVVRMQLSLWGSSRQILSEPFPVKGKVPTPWTLSRWRNSRCKCPGPNAKAQCAKEERGGLSTARHEARPGQEDPLHRPA